MNKNNNEEFVEIEEETKANGLEEGSQDVDSNVEEAVEKNKDEIINDLKIQLEVLQDKVLRSFADNENIRKRYEKRIEEGAQYSITQFAKDLLPVMDNLRLALAHKDDNNFASGVELTKQELTNIFKNNKIEEISPQVGENFDYNVHNAISQIVTNDYPNGSIINIMQCGYRIKDRLLRPALVSVAKNT